MSLLPVFGYASIAVELNRVGLAGQAGVDVRVANNGFIKREAKYVRIKADNVHITGGVLAGTKVTDLGINPWLLSAGVGYRF